MNTRLLLSTVIMLSIGIAASAISSYSKSSEKTKANWVYQIDGSTGHYHLVDLNAPTKNCARKDDTPINRATSSTSLSAVASAPIDEEDCECTCNEERWQGSCEWDEPFNDPNYPDYEGCELTEIGVCAGTCNWDVEDITPGSCVDPVTGNPITFIGVPCDDSSGTCFCKDVHDEEDPLPPFPGCQWSTEVPSGMDVKCVINATEDCGGCIRIQPETEIPFRFECDVVDPNP